MTPRGWVTPKKLVFLGVLGLKKTISSYSFDCCWLGDKRGIRTVKKYCEDGGGGHWLVRMEWRPAVWSGGWSVNLPLHHEVQKFSSGTGSPGWSRKKSRKTVVVWCGGNTEKFIHDFCQG